MSIWRIGGFAASTSPMQYRTIRRSQRTGTDVSGKADCSGYLFEMVLQRCIDEGLVGGESFGVDASLIPANANQTRGICSKEGLPPELTARAIDEYLETLDDAAFGGPTRVVPKYISPVDPAALDRGRWRRRVLRVFH